MTKKCRMFSLDERAWKVCRGRKLIPNNLSHTEEGIYVTENGDRLRGIPIFNVPIGKPRYVEAVLRKKADEVANITRVYVLELKEEYPQKLWTLLQYSLSHRCLIG